jgi:hypothetical protein
MACLAEWVPYVKPKNQKPLDTEDSMPSEPTSTCCPKKSIYIK